MVANGCAKSKAFEAVGAVAGAAAGACTPTTIGLARYVTFSPASSAAAVFTEVNTFAYSPQRQMLPDRPSAICASVGFGTAARSATVDMMKPRVQMPHWNPPFNQNERCTGWSPSMPGAFARPATVVI